MDSQKGAKEPSVGPVGEGKAPARRPGQFVKGDPRIKPIKDALALQAASDAGGEPGSEDDSRLLADMRWVYRNAGLPPNTPGRKVLKKLLTGVPKEFIAQLARLEEAEARRKAAAEERARDEAKARSEADMADEGTQRAAELLKEEWEEWDRAGGQAPAQGLDT